MRLLPLLLTASFLTPVPVRAQNPPAAKPSPTSPAPTGQPFTEVQFYRLLQENQGRDTLTEDVERALREHGISFEVTDTILDSARELGATPRVVAALMKAEENRRKNGGTSSAKSVPASPETPTVETPSAPTAQPAEQPTPASQPAAQTSQPTHKRTPILAGSAAGSSASPEERVAEQVAQRKAEEQAVLDKARERARAYVAELPDFTLSEIITRSELFSGTWRNIDQLKTVISYEHGRGEKSRLVSVNGKRPKGLKDDLPGAMSIGTVSSQLTGPFRPQARTTFEYSGRELYRFRDCLVFTYRVSRFGSEYKLIASGPTQPRQSIVVAFSGRIWIERDSGYALRIERVAEEIPEDFPITDAETIVDYDWVDIGEKRFWLPIRAEAVMGSKQRGFFSRYSGQVFYLNVTEFRDYRKFEADVKVVD
jgi:hypothetical protein